MTEPPKLFDLRQDIENDRRMALQVDWQRTLKSQLFADDAVFAEDLIQSLN